MKGLTINEKGQVILQTDLPHPVQQAGEVLIKVEAASLNPYDLESAAGHYDGYFQDYGVDEAVQTGLEFAGTVTADGTRFKKGDRVYGYVHLITGAKTHAEYISLPEDYVATLPASLNFAQGAALPLGLLTSLAALEDLSRPPHKDKNLLIIGAKGGIGVYGLQVARELGYHVHAVDEPDATDFLMDLGAERVLDRQTFTPTDHANTYDLILDLSTTYSLTDCRIALKEGGIFIPALPDEGNGGTTEDPQVGYLMVSNGDGPRLEAWADKITAQTIRPILERTFPFEDHKQAFQHLTSRGKTGKSILCW